MERLNLCRLLLIIISRHYVSASSLYPRQSESRQIQDLNGMWQFRADFSKFSQEGFNNKWNLSPLSKTGPVMSMPVPSSFNDITTNKRLRDFVGVVWYDREFYISPDWKNRRVVLRFDSAHYSAVVYVNGKAAFSHIGGHLPFEGEVNTYLDFSGLNRVTMAINNTLTPYTLPPGSITYHHGDPSYPPDYFVQNLQFDFFNYAGIHRSVRLYVTPFVYVDDITIATTEINNGKTAQLKYAVSVGNRTPGTSVSVAVLDRNGSTVATSDRENGDLAIENPRLWWPYTMNQTDFGYLYALKVIVKSAGGIDIYRQPFGIRTVAVTKTQILINGAPFYCHGAAKHEDSDIRGKGLDFALIARDFSLLKWLGANCFRTSHYPYAEEIMDQADEQGIVVIDECPGVGITEMENFSNKSLSHHLDVMTELVQRDKNRPAVIAWSVANEPVSSTKYAEDYFRTVIEHTRSLDKTRLVTFVANSQFNKDRVAQFTDFQCINRYFGWYQDIGHIETIPTKLSYDLNNWYKTIQKPLMITEYGADTVAGLHTEPSYIFTEDYQVEFMHAYHQVFDEFKDKFLVGEMVWNFADFMTAQNVNRVVGNKKGIFTRQRQPKASAHLLRWRYWKMINKQTYHDEL